MQSNPRCDLIVVTISVVTGIRRDIRRLSELDMILAGLLMRFALHRWFEEEVRFTA